MFDHIDWRLLQLFGGEGGASGASPAGDGGNAAAAATGETTADAGQQRLRELGVPEGKIRKPRAKQTSPLPDGAFRTQEQVQKTQTQAQVSAGQVAAAEDDTNTRKTEAPARMSWDEIVKDPEYNAEIQKLIKARVKNEGQSKAVLETLDPAIRHLAKHHGLDPDNVDHTALVNKITGKYADKALELGVSEETAMMLDQQQRNLEQQKFQNHILKLQQQEQELKAVIPDFDLRKEMQNPTFARLTSPGVGLSVEQAFNAVHYKEMQQRSMQVAAQKTQEMISNAMQSGTNRPDEAGTVSQAPSVSRFDYKNASPAQRKALKDEIYRAAAEGRKIYPG